MKSGRLVKIDGLIIPLFGAWSKLASDHTLR